MRALILTGFLAILATGCVSFPVGPNGGRLRIGLPIQSVVVTNSLSAPCHLERNGERVDTLFPLQTTTVFFEDYSPQMHLECKVYRMERGREVGLGTSVNSFSLGSYMTEKKKWDIYSYQPLTRVY